MKLTVVTPQREIFNSLDVRELVIPGKTGEIGILPGHAPLVSPLGEGVMKYRVDKAFESLSLKWGYCEVQADRVVILAESAGDET